MKNPTFAIVALSLTAASLSCSNSSAPQAGSGGDTSGRRDGFG